MAQPILTLQPGQRFRLAALPDRTGELIRLGEGSAVVRYDGGTKEIHARNGDVAFEVPGRPVTISLTTMVVPEAA